MNKSNLNRRELMRLLSLTMAGAALLPASSFAGATDKGRTVFIPPGEGKKGKMGVNDIVFKLNRSQTDGNLGSAEIVLQPGLLGSIPHYHNSFDEVCIVLEGSVTIKIENEIYNVAAGGMAFKASWQCSLLLECWNYCSTVYRTLHSCRP